MTPRATNGCRTLFTGMGFHGPHRGGTYAVIMALCALGGLTMGGCPQPIPGGTTPTADDQQVDVLPGGSVSIELGVSNPGGGSLTFAVTTLPAHGGLLDPNSDAITESPYTLVQGGNLVTYTPDADFTGPDSFTFTASNATNTSGEATVSINVAAPPVSGTISEDVTLASLVVAENETVEVANNAVITVTGDASVNGLLFATSGRITLQVDGALTINGRVQALDETTPPAAETDPLNQQAAGIYIVIGDQAATIGESAILETTGHVVVTDDVTVLDRSPAELFDEVEDVAGDDLPTIVPLPPDNPAFDNAPAKVVIQPMLQGATAAPVTVSGTWPPAGAAPPPGDQPVWVFRFTGSRDLNLDGWTFNGPAAPAGPDGDTSANPGDEAQGANGKRGMRLNIFNTNGAINIVNDVVINLPDGGDGGAADAICANATGGDGALSGNLRMTAANGIDITGGTLTINPGSGGQGGEATVLAGAPGAAGCPGEDGDDSTATGGKGGDNKKRIFARGNVDGLENVTIGALLGGDGGNATATACDGGAGDPCCDGGNGGTATATGGKGGDASLSIGGLPVATSAVTAGFGGDATATGGNGGDGGDCKFGDGGDGGAGGAANATGGAGGNAANGSGAATGGLGGDGTATGGDGGNGGDSGLGDPGIGGPGGVGTATGGTGGTGNPAGAAGTTDAADGLDGADGGVMAITLYCIDLAFLADAVGPIAPGPQTGPVTDTTTGQEIGTLEVELVDQPGAEYQRGDNPPHIGFSNGTVRVSVSSLHLTNGQTGPIGGLRIVPLYGEGLTPDQPLLVEALDANGQVIDTQQIPQLPMNVGATGELQYVDVGFEGVSGIVSFELVAPPTAFVTIIRIFLLDP